MMIRGVTIKMYRAVLRLKPFKRLEGRSFGAISRLDINAIRANRWASWEPGENPFCWPQLF